MTRSDLSEWLEKTNFLYHTIEHIQDCAKIFSELVNEVSCGFETNDPQLVMLTDELYMEDDAEIAEDKVLRILDKLTEIDETWTDEDFKKDEEV